MRTVVVFALVAVALFGIGTVTAAAFLQPRRDLFLRPPPEGAQCQDAYVLHATGSLAWLTLEGGMWEFTTAGDVYDVEGVELFLPPTQVAQLQSQPGTGVPARVEGVVEPCLATFHMHGVVLRVTALDVDSPDVAVR